MSDLRFDATRCEQTASDWVVRAAAGLSATEKEQLARWLDGDPRHAAAYRRLQQAWAVFDRAKQHGIDELIAKRAGALVRRRRNGWRALAVAAVVAIAGGWWFLPNTTRQMVQPVELVSVPERLRKLPDGSIVELKEDAQIAVDYREAFRDIRLLKGEAHFRVEKDARRPFRVIANNVEVRAVGTAFAVSLAPADVEVVVTEGRVNVDHVRGASEAPAAAFATETEPTVVDAGSRIIVPFSAPPVGVESMDELAMEQRLAWRQVRMTFENVPLRRAVAQFNRSNRLQIEMADEATGGLAISGVFRSDNPDGFVRIVSATFDLEIQERDGRIVLRRR